MPNTLEGFDASGWSGSIDCRSAKNNGMNFAYFRVGRGIQDGATNLAGIDDRWATNKKNAIDAQLPVGGYWRFFPSVDLWTQCNKFAVALGQKPGMLAPLVDVEDDGGLAPVDLTSWTLQALKWVEQLTGRSPILYTGKNFYDNKLQYQKLYEYELCIAWQTASAWPEYGSIFWQYKLDVPSPWSQGKIDHIKFALPNLSNHLRQTKVRYWIDTDGMIHGPMMWTGKLMPEAGKQGTQPNYVNIVHTMVGYLNGTDSYFRQAGISLESSLGIGCKYDGDELDGAVYQWMYIQDRADANSDANGYATSIETADGGGNRYLERWSVRQAESIAQVQAAWCIRFNRPPVLVDRAHSSQRGLAYHRQGIDPWRMAGDDRWSPDRGKVCPGEPRINQYINNVIPRVKEIVDSLSSDNSGGGGAPEPEPEVDMQLDDVVYVRNGTVVTVRDVFRKVHEEPSADGEAILLAISNHDFDNKTRLNGVTAHVQFGNGSLTWADLETMRWSDVATAGEAWGSLLQ